MRLLGTLLWLSVLALGCDRGRSSCRALLTSAQTVIDKVDPRSAKSVEESLRAVEGALAACREEKLNDEAAQLGRARNELVAQLKLLDQRKNRKKRPPPAPIEERVAHGDSDCPEGMAYRAESGQEIKCTGPAPANMPWAQARKYYDARGFKLTTEKSPPTLSAEYGVELWVFRYQKVNDPSPPRCLILYPRPELSWQEAVARATGAPLRRIEEGKPVPVGKRELDLDLDRGENKLVIRLGSCGEKDR